MIATRHDPAPYVAVELTIEEVEILVAFIGGVDHPPLKEDVVNILDAMFHDLNATCAGRTLSYSDLVK